MVKRDKMRSTFVVLQLHFKAGRSPYGQATKIFTSELLLGAVREVLLGGRKEEKRGEAKWIFLVLCRARPQ